MLGRGGAGDLKIWHQKTTSFILNATLYRFHLFLLKIFFPQFSELNHKKIFPLLARINILLRKMIFKNREGGGNRFFWENIHPCKLAKYLSPFSAIDCLCMTRNCAVSKYILPLFDVPVKCSLSGYFPKIR